ncbi:hypothetical protein [Halovivax limisalsi]|uniref:hypothetical protein n=1 Tax=Halovivax limisalsi TaxID=1453760 RepID=UPI001FFD895A|nr:hypothetical protein [Halovivax limisalsi]
MDATTPTDPTETNTPLESSDRTVTCHKPRPGRFVFVERDNVDGWIATDACVELTR